LYNLNYTPIFGGYKVEEKLHLGVREQKRLNTIHVDDQMFNECEQVGGFGMSTAKRNTERKPTHPYLVQHKFHMT
jgi:hypothetical protein